MDEATLASLSKALDQSPENVALRMVLVRAHDERGAAADAARLLSTVQPDDLASERDRLDAAKALVKAGEAARALLFCGSDDAESLLVQARAFSALGRRDDALRAYQRGVAANPTLEDLDLKAALAARVHEGAAPRGNDGDATVRRLKVIANDDTDDDEMARLLKPEAKKVTFDDVGGLGHVKGQIHKKIILPFQKPSLFERFKKKAGGGILMYGPPGCGKTLLARATAGECGAAFFNVAIEDVLDMWIGESERKLHAIFEKARASAPAVLFFDELEALAGKRQYHREGTSAKLVSLFLSEMDGFSKNNQGVLILGATNVPWSVDPAFRRPGRFDRVLFVPPPDREARASILRLLLDGRPTAGGFDLDGLAGKTAGFSGADLENLVESAADLAIEASLTSGGEVPITEQHLKGALKEVKATTLEWLTTARNHARYANEGGQYDEVLEFLAKHGKG